MAVEYLDKDNSDGTNFGRSADKIGFYGLTTPIVKQTIAEAIVAGGSLACVARAVINLQAALKKLGLITTV
jgi:hypothetical protein